MVSIIQGLLVSNPNYVYPLAINIVAATIPVWAGLQVGGARKRTGLKYPAEYWDGAIDEKTDREKFLFNCTQRAHQNLLENLPSFFVAFNVCALSFPRFAAAVGATWAVGRVLYQLGYGKKGPKGRGFGSILGSLSAITLLGGAIYGLATEYLAIA